jgi:hypothetical protein
MDSSYLDLGQPDGDRERTAYFVLDSLLRSRIQCGFESNTDRYDEDVNIYLVDLLSKLVQAPGLGAMTADRDHDVFAQVRDSDDPRFKSLVYRVNADHLLLTTSLFTETPYEDKDGCRTYDPDARGRIGRGKAYYGYASLFQGRLRSVSPAVSRVLQLLSEDFERYVDVLFHMRGEYFHLFERMREDHIMSLQEELFSTPEGEIIGLRALRDDFLDAYWAWQQAPDAATEAALDEACRRLRSVDPSFGFEPPTHQ